MDTRSQSAMSRITPEAVILSILCSSPVLFGSRQLQESEYPHPKTNPESSVMLTGDWVPADPHQINFSALPRIPSEHVVISDVRTEKGVNQHNYLTYYSGRYWAMWSDGPGVEDRVGQRVAFTTSGDGLDWSDPKYITSYPPNSRPDSPLYNTRSPKGFRYISRGFWQREGRLLALASLDEAGKFFGPSLELHAFRLNPDNDTWEDMGVVYDNTINNFPPKLLPNGEWMMTRRTDERDVYMLTGGTKSLDQWQAHPVVSYGESGLRAEEPYWWVLPDNNLLALFRDNAGSGFLFRAFSMDNGRTWTKPVRTDFPDARSKFNGLQLSDGRFVLVSNPNPKKRDPLALSISNDGLVFHKMGYLVGGRHVDYPHVIEHNGCLLVAFSGGKQSVEVLKIKVSDLDRLKMPTKPLVAMPHPVTNPQSPLMLAGDWVPNNTRQIDFDHLPRLSSKHVVINDVRDLGGTWVNQHGYLAHYQDRFWAMWSDGPG
ncbi:MAG: exo-alpha-sialidase, partial [Planctomycetota bacterium]